MEIQLIEGQFSNKDAIDIVTQMIQVKIKYHENKILNSHTEEDVKMREKKIKSLQNELASLRDYLNKQNGYVSINSKIIL